MKRYFAGNTLASFSRSSAAVVESTAAGRFDSAYTDCAIFLPGGLSNYIEPPSLGAITGTVWAKWECWVSSVNGIEASFTLYNGATGVFRLIGTNSSILTPQYWNGSAWVSGTAFTPPSSSLFPITIKVVLGTSWEIFIAGFLVASGTMAGSPPLQITRARWQSIGPQGCFISQIMMADYDLRDDHWMHKRANGNGHYTDGSGDYTSINDVVLNEATAITLSSVGQKKTFTKPSMTIPSGLVIAAAGVGMRMRLSGGVINNARALIRSGSTDASSVALGPSGGYEPRVALFENNPATAAPWTPTGFNALEFGVEAV